MTTTTVPRAATIPAAMAAEWHKLRSIRSTWWFLLGALLIMVLTTLLEADDGDPGTVQAASVAVAPVANFIQYVLGAFGALAITSEFATRSITVTFACTPSRTRVMVAKTLVVGGLVLAVGTAVAVIGVLLSATRFGELGMLDGLHALDALAIGTYLALLAVLALGIGTLVRHTAGTLAILVLLIVLVPEILRIISERFGLEWIRTIGDHTPAPVGYRLMGGEWQYGLVLMAWAAATVAAGIWALRARDA